VSRARATLLAVLVLALAGCSTSWSPQGRVPRVPMIWVPAWGVHVVEGYDIVFYEQAYYFYYDRRWYVAASPSGPWAIVATPPAVLAGLPPGGFHLRLPPPQ
jgi:hypothetical protein